MAQPVKHSPDAMLDAARDLILHAGPAAASARAVSLVLGAPSGSIYHRFPRRDDLIAATWLRAQDRFLAAYLDAFSHDDGRQAAVTAAGTVLTWSLANPQDAALLLRYALRDLLHADTTPALHARAQANQERLSRALTTLAAALDQPIADLTLAAVDLPYAVTRRVLRTGTPAEAELASLRRAVSLLVGARTDPRPHHPIDPP